MDKNPDHILDDQFMKIKNEFSNKTPIIILCQKPFLKSEFLNRLIDASDFPIFFIDFDLLYSGYVNSGMIKKKHNVKILHSNRDNLQKDLKEIVKIISERRLLIIIDSLNGFYNIFDELESAREIMGTIMLLSSIARSTCSQIIVSGVVTRNETGEYLLSPSGRQIINSTKTGLYYLSSSDSKLILNLLDGKSVRRTFVIGK